MRAKNIQYIQFPYIYIAVLIILLYQKAIFFGFSYMDDHILILQNYDFLKNISNFFEVFKRDVFYPAHNPFLFYRPFLTLSFMMDAHLTGISPVGYHITNIFLHVIASCLFFSFLTQLDYARIPSFFMACIFAVHPALSQAVAWIPGRNDSLLAIFVLAALITFTELIRTKKTIWYFWHALFFLSAIFTKESALAIAPLCLIYHRLIVKNRGFPKKIKIILSLWVFIALIWLYLRSHVLINPIHWTVFDATRSLTLVMPGFIQYIGKIIFPFNLSVAPILRDTSLLYGYIAIPLLILILFRSQTKRSGFLIFGAAWFIFFLLPSLVSLNFGAIVSDFMEHRLYVPIIGFAIITLESGAAKALTPKNKRALIAGAAVAAIFAAITYSAMDRFENRISFWEDAVKTSPHSSTVHRLLGFLYYLDGNLKDSEKECRMALALDPQEPFVHNKLGRIYAARGESGAAEKEYREEIILYPTFDETYVNLATLFYKENNRTDAAVLWKRALALNPENVEAAKDLAIYYCEEKNPEALNYVEMLQKKGIKIPPDFMEKVRSITQERKER